MIEGTLTDVCTAVVDCKNRTAPEDPYGTHFAVGTPAMRGNVINLNEARRINDETFAEWTARLSPQAGDLLFAREAPVGPVVEIPKGISIAPGQRTMLLRADPTKANSRFLRYYLISPVTQARLHALAHGSTVPHLRLPVVRDFYVSLPELPVQKAIADVLGALDDKIAINVKLASTADEWVRAEYDILAGQCDKQRSIAEIVLHSRNAANPESFDVHVPYVGLEHIPRRSMWLAEHGTSDEVSSNKSRFNSGDILFGKLRPYFHKIVSAPKAGICSTDVLVLTPVDKALSGFALASLTHDSVVQAVTAASEGTRMPRTSWKDLSTIDLPWPGQETAEAFSTKVSSVREYVVGLLAENQTLAATRDALLPQLLSGKLCVKDAKTLIEPMI